jgi:S-adenosylmethionine synthetase
MKVVITGATGLLGRSVYTEFNSTAEFDNVIGLGWSRAQTPITKIDLLDSTELSKFLRKESPDVLIHCAAERRPDVAMLDVEKTIQLNVGVCQQLAVLSDELSFKLIYISTDYVFDGKNPPYNEQSEPHPINFYGDSKLKGEQEILKAKDSICLRVPILYGNTENLEESAVNILARTVYDEKQGVVDDSCLRYPTYVSDIATVLLKLSLCKSKGIYHFSAKEQFTKFQMCKIFAEIMNIELLLKPTKEQSGADRPLDCKLDNTKIESINIEMKCIKFKSFFEKFLPTQFRQKAITLEYFNTELTAYRFPLESNVMPTVIKDAFYSFTVTKDEISIIQPSSVAINGFESKEVGWNYFKVVGPLDFNLKGIISKLTLCLAQSVPVFVVSTFDTDYILIKKDKVEEAIAEWTAIDIAIKI